MVTIQGYKYVGMFVLAALVLTVACIFSMDSSSAEPTTFTDGGAKYTLSDDGGVYTATASWDGSSTEVTIESSVTYEEKTYSVTSVGPFAKNSVVKKVTIAVNNNLILSEATFSQNSALTTVILGEGLTSLPDNFCLNAKKLTSITIPSSVQSLGSHCFENCAALTSVTIPVGVKEIPISAFKGCSKLETISTSGIENFGENAFYGCKVLASLDLSSAKVIGDGAFAQTAVKTIIIPDTIQSIGVQCFVRCSALTSVTLPADMKVIPESTFSGCSKLETISTSGVENFGENSFKSCKALAAIDLSSAKTIENGAFSSCTNLTSVVVPDSLADGGLGTGCFQGCTSLSSIVLPSGLKAIPNNTFNGCSALSSVTAGVIEDYGANSFLNCTVLSSIDLSSAKTIGGAAFSGCNALKTIVLPESLEDIEQDAFKRCKGLESVTVVKPSVTFGINIFEGCDSLTSVVLTNDVTHIPSGTFYQCTSLESIDLNKVGSIGPRAFYGCSKLDNVVIPDTLVDIGDSAFADCSSLKSIALGVNLKKIGDSAFKGTAITQINIPASATDVKWFGTALLFPNTLESLIIDSGNESYVMRDGIVYAKDMSATLYCPPYLTGERTVYADISGSAFKDSKLSVVIIADGVKNIGNGAFNGASNLREIIIPESVETIGQACFGNTALTSIVLPSNLVSLGGAALNAPSLQYVEFPDSGFIAGAKNAFNPVKFYYSDGSEVPGTVVNETYSSVAGMRFVWDGTTPGKFYQISDDQVLFATTIGEEVTYKAVPKNSTLSLESPNAPEHMVFGGWFKDAGFTEAYDGTAALVTDTATYALFSLEKHTVTYLVDGEEIGVETYEYGTEVSVRPVYVKVGYTVGDWTSENVNPVDGCFTVGDVDIVFTATSTVNQYTITFDTVGGSAIAAITQDYNTSVTVPSAEPSKGGYRFVKWDPEVPASMPANDVTLKAVWAIVATVNENGKSIVTLDSETSSFIPAAETKEITVEIRENTAVKVENASDLVGKTVVSKVEPVSNSTGVSGTAYEFTFTADGTQYNGKIQVTLPYTKEAGKEPVVYYWNGSESTKMNVVSSTDTSVTFETDHNSMYVVASETPSKDDGLSFLLFFGLLMVVGIAVSMLVGFNFYRKKA